MLAGWLREGRCIVEVVGKVVHPQLETAAAAEGRTEGSKGRERDRERGGKYDRRTG